MNFIFTVINDAEKNICRYTEHNFFIRVRITVIHNNIDQSFCITVLDRRSLPQLDGFAY